LAKEKETLLVTVQLKLPGSGSRTFEANITNLPATVKLPAPKQQLFGGLIVSFIFSLMGYFLFKDGIQMGGVNPNTLFGLAIGGYGALTMAKSLLSPKGQTQIIFHKDQVDVKTSGWIKSTQWQEPYSNYKGVSVRTKETPSRPASAPYQIIELIHKDDTSKTLPLYAARRERAPSEHLKHYADILRVEILNQ